MKRICMIACLAGPASSVQAHVSELPAPLHDAQHAAWLLALIPLLALLRPLFRHLRR